MTWLKLTEKELFLMEGGTNQFLEKVPVVPKTGGTLNEFELDLTEVKKWMTRANPPIPGVMAIEWQNGSPATTMFVPPTPTLGVDASKFTEDIVKQIFFDAPRGNIRKYLPKVLHYLETVGLGDREAILMALGTIRAETAGFEPISEFISPFNTSPDGHPFDLYDFFSGIGNGGFGDGARFKGRGFIQLTGKFNYDKFSKKIYGDDRLVQVPDLANDPDVAAKLLAEFLKDAERPNGREIWWRGTVTTRDFEKARKSVNGGTHGLSDFVNAFTKGEQLVP
ncbi:MAG: peptidoglycan-binding protein [Pseudanabaena sp. CAN_BIN31]|nr:peptidoglycan-binding protein [Pseudanabaena sp. CAN_BIN31]